MNDDDYDPFVKLEEKLIPASVRLREQRANERKQKALDEKEVLLKLWKKWHAKKAAELLTGAYGQEIKRLTQFLESMQLIDGETLIEHCQTWAAADLNMRYHVLALVNRRIMCLRETIGLEPIDDALPEEDDTVFQCIRKILMHEEY